MKRLSKKRKMLIGMCLMLLIVSVIFTLLIKFVDVRGIAPDGSNVGFASINSFFKDLFKFNNTWYEVSNVLGFIAILIAALYALLGCYQLVQVKKISKVDKRLIALGGFYVVFAILYVLFDRVAINVRPVMLDGELEASFPSTHTMLALCICGSSILISKYFVTHKEIRKFLDVICWLLMISIVVTRMLSGVHWFTDILGGIIISLFLLMMFYTVIYFIDHTKNTEEQE